jgi:dTDP-4-amino-4,6-dideoxygalactose transaminase
MPSFHCGVEVEAAIQAGWKVDFYRIQPDLSAGLDDLERKLKREPGAVLLIHYFGFPQPGLHQIASLCSRLGCVLIEDCAHALFSCEGAQPLGAAAPVSIYSLRKTLPLFDGGALRVNPTLLAGVCKEPFRAPEAARFSLDPYRVCLKRGVRGLIGDRMTAIYRRWRWKDEEPAHSHQPPADLYSEDRYDLSFSALSRRIAASADPAREAARRRENWQSLRAQLPVRRDYELTFDSLPDGVCPLFLCVRCGDRDGLMDRMAARGVETFRFGASPHPRLDPEAYPEAAILRSSIVGLPVHSGLKPEDPESIARALEYAL